MDTNYAATYAAMADEELLALVADSDELTDEARKALWTELRRRGMEQQAQDTYENRPKQPASPATPPPNLVSVAYFDNVIHANLAKTKLTSEGIQCYLADEHVVRMNLFYSLAVGRIRLMVRESDRRTRSRPSGWPEMNQAHPRLIPSASANRSSERGN